MVRAVVCGLAVSLLVACGGGGSDGTGRAEDDGAVRVAAFDFPESVLLAELYSVALEEAGVPVHRTGAIGPREITFPALEQGHVDVVPEYLGAATWAAGAEGVSGTTIGLRRMLAGLLRPRGLLVADPSPAEDVDVVVVTAATAERHDLASIGDLDDLAAELRFGGPPECPERPLCLVGLEERYGLVFAEFRPQRSMAFTSEALRRGEIEVASMFSTAAELDGSDLVVLRDDLRLHPPQNVVPVVRADAVAAGDPTIIATLDEVSARLTTGELRRLNHEVADGGDARVVASRWLRDVGLVAATD